MRISIASGKGGTGKTTVASNLAKLLSLEYKTVLADLDVEEPNSMLFFDVVNPDIQKVDKYIPQWNKDKCTNCGHCSKVCNFNAIMDLAGSILTFPNLCHSCYACSELCPSSALDMVPQQIGEITSVINENFVIMQGKMNTGEEMAVPVISQTKKTAEALKSDFLIYDCPPGTSCPMVESVKNTDFTLLVTEPTPFGLHDLKMALDVINKLNIPSGIVINKYTPDTETEKFLIENNFKIVGKIPLLREAAISYSNGELMINNHTGILSEVVNIKNFLVKFKEGNL